MTDVQARPTALPGVHLRAGEAARARVWAPACRTLEVVVLATGDGRPERPIPLERDEEGFFAGELPDVRAGDRYWLRLDGERLRPDPASRFQPEGPHGPSQIVDPHAFQWSDANWPGVAPEGQVLYEMHVGTFTPEGTWAAAAAQLDELARLGVTVVEMMPVADFAGRFGWGYDGVNVYAPTRLYGTPDDLRAFVDRAHALGLGVILDVVYNHLGPDGNYLADFSPDYFTDKYRNDWGQAINFEGPWPAREFFVGNAAYWIADFHFDGLRLDATQDIHDASEEHVLRTIVRRCRQAAGRRRVYLVAENEPQQASLVRPESTGGFGMDAVWNDDFHHSAVVALTGRREAYYTDYRGQPQEFVSAARRGYLYQGQWYRWQRQRRGTPSRGLPPNAFVTFLENHDQVANSAFGRRLHQLASPARYRALTAVMLLGPATPMLFQGQEFASSAPFLYFADHRTEIEASVRRGRREFLEQFPRIKNDASVAERLPSPTADETFRRCRLDPGERQRHVEAYLLHADLLRIRREDPVIRCAAALEVDGAVLGRDTFVLRYFGDERGDRLLIVNLGPDYELSPAPEPLLAPPEGTRWAFLWSSESARYGGNGTAPLEPHAWWHMPAETTVLLHAEPRPPDEPWPWPDEATEGAERP